LGSPVDREFGHPEDSPAAAVSYFSGYPTPLVLKEIRMFDSWIVLNLVVQIAFDVAIYVSSGRRILCTATTASNRVDFNVGYHNEHHDLPSVPLNYLTKIRSGAQKLYELLVYHSSWTTRGRSDAVFLLLACYTREARQQWRARGYRRGSRVAFGEAPAKERLRLSTAVSDGTKYAYIPHFLLRRRQRPGTDKI
jgi:hypothetical protein